MMKVNRVMNQIFVGETGSGKTTKLKEHMLSNDRAERNKLIIHDYDEYQDDISELQNKGFQY